MVLSLALGFAADVHETVAHAAPMGQHDHASAEHLADTDADSMSGTALPGTSSLMHLLMHLPLSGADTVALLPLAVQTDAATSPSLPRLAPGPSGGASSTPDVPYRPPITG